MYTIVSPRVGTPGDEYTPAKGTNVEALLANGFIVKTVKPKPASSKDDKIASNKE
jgi:hypothetical protein